MEGRGQRDQNTVTIKKTFNRFNTKDNCTGNITHNTESTAD
jgi:hypothetical protein